MSRSRPGLGTALLVLVACVAVAATPRAARAVIGGAPGLSMHFSKHLYNLCTPNGGDVYTCTHVLLRVDPPSVQHVVMTQDYDFSGPGLDFVQAMSGPLGVFSVGGSAPPATPRVGLNPWEIAGVDPDVLVPDTPGAPLPGSILTYLDNGIAVTVDYQLAAPIDPVPVETNFFLLAFEYEVPLVIAKSLSTVDYGNGPNPNADIVELFALCESGDPANPDCGSLHPIEWIELHPFLVPEPSVAALLGAGLVVAAAWRWRRRG